MIREEIQKLTEGQVKIWKSPQGVLRRNKDWSYSVFKSMDDMDANKAVLSNVSMDDLASWGAKNKKQFKAMGLSGFTESITEEVKEPPLITKIRWIVDNKQFKKINGQVVDAFTAQHVIQVYDALGDKNKEQFGKMKLEPMVNLTWKLFKKVGK